MIARSSPANGAVIQNEIDAGEQSSSSVGYEYTYDTRRGGIDPTQGVLVQFSQDFSGLGGDSQYIKTVAKVVGERKVFNEEVTLRATLEGGALAWSSGANRTVDRFILGPNIIRGFEPGGIGPRDQSACVDATVCTTADDALGGNLYVAARFEAEFPIGLPEELGVTGGVFYDVGNLWDLSDANLTGGNVVGESGSFRHVIGVSVFWDSVLGPIQFNFSNALRSESFDREQSFEVTLRTRF